ncbi:uncharacterized protein LOC136085029 [Hydra vulgaris]|uniref:Uncharacterized protein LOC136085029 n=1 Tax=Hydra vulgaris TaxID=6087 RepID=A0ABM4CL14_HYDVU
MEGVYHLGKFYLKIIRQLWILFSANFDRMKISIALFLLNAMVFKKVFACSPPANTANDCLKICEHTIDCIYFTWNQLNHFCFLKGGVGWTKIQVENAVGGYVGGSIEEGVDYYGGDLPNCIF